MEWTRGHVIGRGATATVSIATSRSGDVFAVKSVELSKSEFLKREEKILSTLNSPFVVGYIGSDNTRYNSTIMFDLMMEYARYGTLVDATHECGGRLDESMISHYTSQIVQGLKYLHSTGIVHCDIKGRNIVIGEDGAKISDFGCAKRIKNPVEGLRDDQEASIGGTPAFMAPEVARGEEQGFPADIWALGCTVIEMATGDLPWPNLSHPSSLLYRIALSEELPEFPAFLSDKAKDFLNKCLRRNPKERWTATQLVKHPFLEELSSVKKSTKETAGSPTSILDQGIWSFIDESESQYNQSRTYSTLNSPNQRLKQLSMNSGLMVNWNWEDSWLTIRDSEDNNIRSVQ
ncbi:mitogen-activated protein kinase kinase kinase 17-like [Olea europaea var. sylvestris]|uniref:Mitogen-activated kinase kinase kinase A-like n=1 Tax=Olea europaea subsp. europaea TaxID=158383 RepID=A0A8S0PHM3_OLEEU|nr:mitogen-activated protein kinase kinase kinase 17-like [Olea europaea var. sylvestris]XP_022867285.1 mitogen-activated protein kinase kinase kinase 17-like [Olea europaea var. sylvestris]CAA2953300.1 mitogen-activated kinase kinase kinase A-like [Olea europaea subsp. europaea]